METIRSKNFIYTLEGRKITVTRIKTGESNELTLRGYVNLSINPVIKASLLRGNNTNPQQLKIDRGFYLSFMTEKELIDELTTSDELEPITKETEHNKKLKKNDYNANKPSQFDMFGIADQLINQQQKTLRSG